MKLLFLPLGISFGFALSRAGATTYDFYAKLFLFEDLQLLWVMATAASLGMLGMTVLKRFRPKSVVGRRPLKLTPKPYTNTLVIGSLVFGAGWGLAGACPGTALAMLGEGKLGAGVTILGLTLGTALYGMQRSRADRRATAPGIAVDAC